MSKTTMGPKRGASEVAENPYATPTAHKLLQKKDGRQSEQSDRRGRSGSPASSKMAGQEAGTDSWSYSIQYNHFLDAIKAKSFFNRNTDDRVVQALANIAGVQIEAGRVPLNVKADIVGKAVHLFLSDDFDPMVALKWPFFLTLYKLLNNEFKRRNLTAPKKKAMLLQAREELRNTALDELNHSVWQQLSGFTGVFLPSGTLTKAAKEQIINRSLQTLKIKPTAIPDVDLHSLLLVLHTAEIMAIPSFPAPATYDPRFDQAIPREERRQQEGIEPKREYPTKFLSKYWCASTGFCRNDLAPATDALRCGVCHGSVHESCCYEPNPGVCHHCVALTKVWQPYSSKWTTLPLSPDQPKYQDRVTATKTSENLKGTTIPAARRAAVAKTAAKTSAAAKPHGFAHSAAATSDGSAATPTGAAVAAAAATAVAATTAAEATTAAAATAENTKGKTRFADNASERLYVPVASEQVTRFEIKIRMPAYVEDVSPFATLREELVSIMVRLEEFEPTAKVRPWRKMDKEAPDINASEIPEEFIPLRMYFPRLPVDPEEGSFYYTDLYLVHTVRWATIAEVMSPWLREHGHSMWYQKLQVEASRQIAWLFFSFRAIDTDRLAAALKNKHGISVAFRWSNVGGTKKGEILDEADKVKALHMVIPDPGDASELEERKAELRAIFHQDSPTNMFGLQMHYVPLLSSVKVAELRDKCIAYRNQQAEFLKDMHRTGFTFGIQNLDRKASPELPTMRSIIMRMKASDGKRLFNSVDRAWNSHTKHIISFRARVHDEARHAIDTLVPYVLHKYGEKTKAYCTASGLNKASKMQWDQKNNCVMTEDELHLRACLFTKDYLYWGFDMSLVHEDALRATPIPKAALKEAADPMAQSTTEVRQDVAGEGTTADSGMIGVESENGSQNDAEMQEQQAATDRVAKKLAAQSKLERVYLGLQKNSVGTLRSTASTNCNRITGELDSDSVMDGFSFANTNREDGEEELSFMDSKADEDPDDDDPNMSSPTGTSSAALVEPSPQP